MCVGGGGHGHLSAHHKAGEHTRKEVHDTGLGEHTKKEVRDTGLGEHTRKEVHDTGLLQVIKLPLLKLNLTPNMNNKRPLTPKSMHRTSLQNRRIIYYFVISHATLKNNSAGLQCATMAVALCSARLWQ